MLSAGLCIPPVQESLRLFDFFKIQREQTVILTQPKWPDDSQAIDRFQTLISCGQNLGTAPILSYIGEKTKSIVVYVQQP